MADISLTKCNKKTKLNQEINYAIQDYTQGVYVQVRTLED